MFRRNKYRDDPVADVRAANTLNGSYEMIRKYAFLFIRPSNLKSDMSSHQKRGPKYNSSFLQRHVLYSIVHRWRRE
jgi:hypothetical protein